MSHPFNISSTDVVVYLHIQKTGGTAFGHYIVEDSDANCEQHRKKMYKCVRPNDDTEWLFSRFTTGTVPITVNLYLFCSIIFLT